MLNLFVLLGDSSTVHIEDITNRELVDNNYFHFVDLHKKEIGILIYENGFFSLQCESTEHFSYIVSFLQTVNKAKSNYTYSYEYHILEALPPYIDLTYHNTPLLYNRTLGRYVHEYKVGTNGSKFVYLLQERLLTGYIVKEVYSLDEYFFNKEQLALKGNML